MEAPAKEIEKNESEDVYDAEYTCRLTEKEQASLFEHQFTNAYVLTEEDKKFLDENGYVVLKNFIEKKLCDDMVSEMFNR